MVLNYFNFQEFDSPDEIGSGMPTDQGGKMNKEFLFKLDEARMLAGTPFRITSGYRTEAHNKKVGGVKGSSHTKGCAVDIAVNSGLQRSAIVCALAKVGFTRIGIAKTFVHVDLDKEKQNSIWLYD
jgi:zinc D-Ala-D-Ala carboxypeptidase